MATKQYSYKNYEIIYKIFILGQDVSENVRSVEGIESSLDYPQLNEYRISEASFTLKDPDNNYNPQKEDNFYKMNGMMETPPITESGYRSPVMMQAGFIVDGSEQLDTIYSGQILNISKNAKSGDCTILCSDPSQKLRDETMTNFGIDKRIKTEASGGNLHGNYPFYIGVTPSSSESVFGNILTRKNTLRTEGALDETNFEELGTAIQTEGGPLASDPVLQFKAPYRSKTVESIIKKLLDNYDIQSYDIKVPIASNLDGRFFTNLGRPEYETNFRLNNYKGKWSIDETYSTGDVIRGFNDESYTAIGSISGGIEPGSTSSLPRQWVLTSDPGIWQWSGTVTDMIPDEPNNELYLLVSPHGSTINTPPTPNPKPRIIKWNLETDDQEILTLVSENTSPSIVEESWRFVANSDFTTFYILSTRPIYINATRARDTGVVVTRPGYEFGSYDSSEYNNTVNSKVKIHRITTAQTNPVRTTFIDPALVPNNLLPQLAMHYHLGFSRTSSSSQNRLPNRYGNLPDSRRNLYLSDDGSTLYYPFASRSRFGVAKASSVNAATEVITAGKDSDGFNLAGFDFWVDEDNDYIYLAYTFIGTSTSRFRIIRGVL